MRNQIFYKLFKNLADASFTALGNHLETLPYELKRCITITAGGGGSEFIGHTPCFGGFIDGYKDELTKLPEFALCIETIQHDKDINKDIDIADFLIQFLTKLAREKEFFEVGIKRYLDEFHERKKELFSFNIDSFNKVYSRYEKYLYSDRQFIAFAPIQGFELESEDLDLGDFFKIKRMSADELVELWYNYNVLPSFSESRSFRMIKFCIVTEQKSQLDINTELNSIITSLRLWKKGDVGYDTVYYLSKWNPWGGGIRGSTSIFFGNPPVVLKSAEVEEFKNFYENFREVKISDYPFLNIAINRFNYAYERKRQEDKLIDYMVAFEALFSEGSGDLRYKIPIRVAKLLETDFDQRKMIRNTMKAGYDARSNIVHGNTVVKDVKVKCVKDNSKKIPLIEFVPMVEEYLRKSIKKFMEIGNNKDDILEEIDFKR